MTTTRILTDPIVELLTGRGSSMRMLQGVVTAAYTDTNTVDVELPGLTGEGDPTLTPVPGVPAVGLLPAVGQTATIIDSGQGRLLCLGVAGMSNPGGPVGIGGAFLKVVPVKSASYIVEVNEYVPVSLAGTVTLTLPEGPQDQTRVGWRIVARTSGTLIVNCAGGDSFADGTSQKTFNAVETGAIAQFLDGVWFVLTEDDIDITFTGGAGLYLNVADFAAVGGYTSAHSTPKFVSISPSDPGHPSGPPWNIPGDPTDPELTDWDPYHHVSGETSAETAAINNNRANVAANNTAFGNAIAFGRSIGATTIYMPAGLYGIGNDVIVSDAPDIGFVGEYAAETVLFLCNDTPGVCVKRQMGPAAWGKYQVTGPSEGQRPATPIRELIINGRGAVDGSIGLLTGNAIADRIDVEIRSFTGSTASNGHVFGEHGTGSIGWLWQNTDNVVLDTNGPDTDNFNPATYHTRSRPGFSERGTYRVNVRNCYQPVVIDGNFSHPGSPTQGSSFGYNDVKIILTAATWGISIINTAWLYAGDYNFQGNATGTGPFVHIDGNISLLEGSLHLGCEANGGNPIPFRIDPIAGPSARPAGYLDSGEKFVRGGRWFTTGYMGFKRGGADWDPPNIAGAGSFHHEPSYYGENGPKIGGWHAHLQEWGNSGARRVDDHTYHIGQSYVDRWRGGVRFRWGEGEDVGVQGSAKYGTVEKATLGTYLGTPGTFLHLDDDSQTIAHDADPGSLRYSYEDPPDFPSNQGAQSLHPGRNTLDNDPPIVGLRVYRGDHAADEDKFPKFELGVVGGDIDNPVNMQSGQVLGRLQWSGKRSGLDGVTMGAFIRAITTEEWTGSNHVGTSIQFGTASPGNGAPAVTTKFFDVGGIETTGTVSALRGDLITTTAIAPIIVSQPGAGIDALGALRFQGIKIPGSNATYDDGAKIAAYATAVWGSAPTVLGARIDFSTTKNGESNLKVGLRLDHDRSLYGTMQGVSAILNNDQLARFGGMGYDGNAMVAGGYTQFEAAQGWTSSLHGTRWSLYLSTLAGSAPELAMQVSAGKNIGFRGKAPLAFGSGAAGWTAAYTGGNRSGFAASTVSLAALAAKVAQLITDLVAEGVLA